MLARLDVRDARTDLADRLGIGPHRGGPDTAVADSVAAIVEAVRERGDAAVREFTERFDGAELDRFRVTNDECRAAVEATPPEVRDALEVAAGRINEYHQKQIGQPPAAYSADGVTVNNILPGYTRTERLVDLIDFLAEKENITSDKVKARWESEIPMRRLGEPSEFAALAAFLVSERASYITGSSIAVDGGWIKSLF